MNLNTPPGYRDVHNFYSQMVEIGKTVRTVSAAYSSFQNVEIKLGNAPN